MIIILHTTTVLDVSCCILYCVCAGLQMVCATIQLLIHLNSHHCRVLDFSSSARQASPNECHGFRSLQQTPWSFVWWKNYKKGLPC